MKKKFTPQRLRVLRNPHLKKISVWVAILIILGLGYQENGREETWGQRINGNSMFPTIPNNTMLNIYPYKGEQLNTGKIIVFNTGDGDIVHRIIFVGFDNLGIYYGTQGDNSYKLDEMNYYYPVIDNLKVREEHIIGIVQNG